MLKHGVHYLILCPLPLEFDALIGQFSVDERFECILDDQNRRHYSFSIEGKTIKISIFRLPRQGNIFSAVKSSALLSDVYDCNTIVSFGIAGSLYPDDLLIGDVIVPDEVTYYEFWREQNPTPAERFINFSCNIDPDVVSKVIAELDDISIRANRKLASGEKLIDSIDSELISRIKDVNQHIEAIEMEAAGVAAVKYAENNSIQFFAVKGISDLADGNKSTIPKKQQARNRESAAKNAAKVLVKIISNEFSEISKKRISNHPRHNLNIDQGKAVVEQYYAVTPKHFTNKADNNSTLFKAHIYAACCKPPLYYHWKQSGPNIHLVDFVYLCVFSHLKNYDYPFELLVTDSSSSSTDEQQLLKRNIEKLAKTTPTLFSESYVNHSTDVADHSKSRSLINYYTHEIDEIIKQKHKRPDSNQNTVLRFWLEYVPYSARNRFNSNSALVFCWQKHLGVYDKILGLALDFHPALISTPNLEVAGKLLKFDILTSALFIDPNDSNVSHDCIEKIDDEQTLTDLRMLIAKLDSLKINDAQKQTTALLLNQVDRTITKIKKT